MLWQMGSVIHGEAGCSLPSPPIEKVSLCTGLPGLGGGVKGNGESIFLTLFYASFIFLFLCLTQVL